MGYACEGEVYIPMDDWYEFVNKYLPAHGAEVAFGRPSFDDQTCVVVPYALNTECYPGDQATPPAFLKEAK